MSIHVCVTPTPFGPSHHRHDGLIILATNRPYDLDEAMHRRIMLAIEFRQPDHLLRKAIWKCHIPEQMKVADDIDLVRGRGGRVSGGEVGWDG